MRKILEDLCLKQQESTQLFVDNQAAISISSNPVFHDKTKHFKIKYYFLRESQQEGEVKLIYCKSEDQLADEFTKPLPKIKFEELKTKMRIYSIKGKEECEDCALKAAITSVEYVKDTAEEFQI